MCSQIYIIIYAFGQLYINRHTSHSMLSCFSLVGAINIHRNSRVVTMTMIKNKPRNLNLMYFIIFYCYYARENINSTIKIYLNNIMNILLHGISNMIKKCLVKRNKIK